MARKLSTNTTIPIEVQRQTKQLTQWAQEDEASINEIKAGMAGTKGSQATGGGAATGGLTTQQQATTNLLSSKLNTLVNFRGTWNAATAYNINDLVVSAGRGYIALKANTNVAVSTASTWAGL